jgi:hypothetical protein
MKISHLLEMIKRLTRDFFVQKKRLYRKAKNDLKVIHFNLMEHIKSKSIVD